MPKSLTDCTTPEQAHKLIDERVLEAMKPVGMMDLETFRNFIAQKGGRVEQPFPEEKAPRATVPSQRVNIGKQ